MDSLCCVVRLISANSTISAINHDPKAIVKICTMLSVKPLYYIRNSDDSCLSAGYEFLKL